MLNRLVRMLWVVLAIGAAWAAPGERWVNVASGGVGRVTAIAIDPVDGNHWFIGTAGGGVWETKDAGAGWKALTDDQASLAVEALAIASGDSRIIYAGTANAGVIKSTDGGSTWTLVGAGITANALVASSDGRVVVVATHSGIYRSGDGGTTWSLRLAGDATAVAGFEKQFAAVDGRLFRSLDGGETWTAVPGPATGKLALAIAPSDPNTMYVAAQGGGVWRTTNAFDDIPSFTSLYFADAQSDFVLTVDPLNPTILYLGGDSLWKYDGTRWTDAGKQRVVAFSGTTLLAGRRLGDLEQRGWRGYVAGP